MSPIIIHLGYIGYNIGLKYEVVIHFTFYFCNIPNLKLFY